MSEKREDNPDRPASFVNEDATQATASWSVPVIRTVPAATPAAVVDAIRRFRERQVP